MKNLILIPVFLLMASCENNSVDQKEVKVMLESEYKAISSSNANVDLVELSSIEKFWSSVPMYPNSDKLLNTITIGEIHSFRSEMNQVIISLINNALINGLKVEVYFEGLAKDKEYSYENALFHDEEWMHYSTDKYSFHDAISRKDIKILGLETMNRFKYKHKGVTGNTQTNINIIEKKIMYNIGVLWDSLIDKGIIELGEFSIMQLLNFCPTSSKKDDILNYVDTVPEFKEYLADWIDFDKKIRQSLDEEVLSLSKTPDNTIRIIRVGVVHSLTLWSDHGIPMIVTDQQVVESYRELLLLRYLKMIKCR